MKHIRRLGFSSFDPVALEDYFDANRSDLLKKIDGETFLDHGRFFSISDRCGMHDAKLLSLRCEVHENRNNQNIIARLIGPHCDRDFEFSYLGVAEATFNMPSKTKDVPMHEVYLDGGDTFHDIIFEDGRLAVRAESIRFREILHPV